MSIQYAADEARQACQKFVTPEHLLLGLCREPGGVAAQVVIRLGLKLDNLRTHVLRIRLAQMKIVERVVRSVAAPTVAKMKMREELLSHVASVYEQEFDHLGDSDAALAEAARRFGDPVELTRQLQSSIPRSQRGFSGLQRRFGCAPPSPPRDT